MSTQAGDFRLPYTFDLRTSYDSSLNSLTIRLYRIEGTDEDVVAFLKGIKIDANSYTVSEQISYTPVGDNAFLDSENGKMYILQDGQLVEAPGFTFFGDGIYIYDGYVHLVDPTNTTVTEVFPLAQFNQFYRDFAASMNSLFVSMPESIKLAYDVLFDPEYGVNGSTAAYILSPYGKFLEKFANAVATGSDMVKSQYQTALLVLSRYINTPVEPVQIATMPGYGGVTREFTLPEYKAFAEPIIESAAAQTPAVDTSYISATIESWERVAPQETLPFTYIVDTSNNNNYYTNSNIPPAAYIPPIIADDLHSQGIISSPSVGTPSSGGGYPFGTIALNPDFCAPCILAGCPCYETGNCTDGICTNGECYGCTCEDCVNHPCDETDPTPPPDSSDSSSSSGSSSSGDDNGGGGTGIGLDAILAAIGNLFDAVNNIVMQLGAGLIDLAATLINTLASLTTIGGAFKDFLAASFVFIPPEIISLLCLGITLSIVAMVIKFFK